MTMPTINNELLESAKQAATGVSNWADFSNFLFDPENGLITKAFPDRSQRELFLRSDEYKAIRSLLLGLINKSGRVTYGRQNLTGKVHDWRSVTIEEAGIPEKLCAFLRENKPPIETLGDLADWSDVRKKSLTDVQGIGPAKATQIEDALVEFWEQQNSQPEDEDT